MLSVQNLNKKNQVTARSIVCVTCSQYIIFFVLTIDYRTLNLCESDRKQVLSVRLIHCNMTFVGLVIKTIYCNTSSVSPFRVWLGSHLYDSRLGDRLEFYIGQLLPLFQFLAVRRQGSVIVTLLLGANFCVMLALSHAIILIGITLIGVIPALCGRQEMRFWLDNVMANQARVIPVKYIES